MASVPSPSVPMGYVVSWTSMASTTFSGVGSTLTMLVRTLVPSPSTTPATNGTGTPGAATATIVNALSVPLVATSTGLNSVPQHEAHPVLRSKKRAPHDVHSL